MVAYWDDLFALCEKNGLRIFRYVLDVDSFTHHPYNKRLGGPLERRMLSQTCP